MKKIGLLSFPRYYNYGTFLQLYAMETTIEKLGYACEIIDYDRDNNNESTKKPVDSSYLDLIKKMLSIRQLSTLKSRLDNRIFERKMRKLSQERTSLYDLFLSNHFKLGSVRYSQYKELEQTPPQCDAFVVGSDQVWHPLGHFKDPSYFLKFAPKDQRIAYAPSLGVSEIPEQARDWMKEQILDIPFLSVREMEGATEIKALTGRTAKVVLDPTLLLDIKEWDGISVVSDVISKPYLLCYILESDSYIRELAQEIASSLNLTIVVLPVNKHDVMDTNPDVIKAYNTGPAEFVGLFKNASFVCTDSFHGTVFSIIYNCPFFTFKRHNNPTQAALHSRMNTILNITGLTDRVLYKGKDLPVNATTVDFSYANKQIAIEKEKSLLFLSESLNSASS
ncbi:polysaccharide pyruvyl transferase family protein [Moritella yayanosii]|uniref:Polysaccharide pyruvyl transferase domain-containing protein n=1 Tax=Moritella yayanosii TaxID=69539 RepID=A0A330LVG0_9GAMM|nr:polysaccharide pyruvyl transferase family protein [Moritella yayanosii]SQD78035.1 conserved protein of unknown function [Moritella yayanosii]